MSTPVTKTARVLKVGGDDGRFVARASEATVDRDGDIVHPEGFLKGMPDYMAGGGVISAFHNWHDFAIGKMVDFEIDQQRFDFEGMWAPTARGQEARVLYDGGFQRSFSVGMDPLRAEPRFDDDTGQLMGFEFFEQNLLEVAAVLVPAHAGAHLLGYGMKNYGLIPTMKRAGLLKGADIQSVLVPRRKMNREQAQLFVREHGFTPDSCKHVGDEFYRFEQFEAPEGSELKTIPWLDESKLVMVVPKSEGVEPQETRPPGIDQRQARAGYAASTDRPTDRPDCLVVTTKATGLSDRDIRDMLEMAVKDVEPEFDWLWVVAVFDDVVVYELGQKGERDRLFERGYELDADVVTMDSARQEVRRRVVFEPVTSSSGPIRMQAAQELQSGVKRLGGMVTRLEQKLLTDELGQTIRRARRVTDRLERQ